MGKDLSQSSDNKVQVVRDTNSLLCINQKACGSGRIGSPSPCREKDQPSKKPVRWKWTVQESHKEAGLPWWNSVALPTSAHFTCVTRYFGCFELGIPSLEAKSLIRGYWNYLWFCFLSQPPQLFRCLRLLIIFPLFFLVLSPCLRPYWLTLGPSVFLCILLHQLALIDLSNFNILNNLKFFKSSLLLPG